jgi:hypothetical protein
MKCECCGAETKLTWDQGSYRYGEFDMWIGAQATKCLDEDCELVFYTPEQAAKLRETIAKRIKSL